MGETKYPSQLSAERTVHESSTERIHVLDNRRNSRLALMSPTICRMQQFWTFAGHAEWLNFPVFWTEEDVSKVVARLCKSDKH